MRECGSPATRYCFSDVITIFHRRSPFAQRERDVDLPYDLKQFAPITQIANVENVLVVSAKSPVKTVAELIALGPSKARSLLTVNDSRGGNRQDLWPRQRRAEVTMKNLERGP